MGLLLEFAWNAYLLCVYWEQVGKEFWRKAASHVVPLLKIERSLLLQAVTVNWIIPFAADAAYTAAEIPNANPIKSPLPAKDIKHI